MCKKYLYITLCTRVRITGITDRLRVFLTQTNRFKIVHLYAHDFTRSTLNSVSARETQ